jgi:hypothetical protein
MRIRCSLTSEHSSPVASRENARCWDEFRLRSGKRLQRWQRWRSSALSSRRRGQRSKPARNAQHGICASSTRHPSSLPPPLQSVSAQLEPFVPCAHALPRSHTAPLLRALLARRASRSEQEALHGEISRQAALIRKQDGELRTAQLQLRALRRRLDETALQAQQDAFVEREHETVPAPAWRQQGPDPKAADGAAPRGDKLSDQGDAVRVQAPPELADLAEAPTTEQGQEHGQRPKPDASASKVELLPTDQSGSDQQSARIVGLVETPLKPMAVLAEPEPLPELQDAFIARAMLAD